MKKLLFTRKNNQKHWVGNGFPVRTIFSYSDVAKEISPFLLMDYGGPHVFTPTESRRCVEEHPHRGFEMVTIVYEGEVTHQDSAGGGGTIKSGDVQWMTAASGLVHEEFHGDKFAKAGGLFEMVQLWVNLPAKNKMTKPRYQGITANQIPNILLADNAGVVKVIAGEFQVKGPAKTFSPIDLWDMRLSAGHTSTFKVPNGNTCSLFIINGEIILASGELIKDAELAVLDPEGTEFTIEALSDSKVLFLGGQPLNEPIVGHGPFVMNSVQEINQAIMDYQAGLMGKLERIEGSEIK